MEKVSRKLCPACSKEVVGRADKKFCDVYCKSAYQYKQVQEGTNTLYAKVTRQLKLNRSILKRYNKAGKATVPAQTLLDQGFHPRFITHYWKNKNANIYLFVFEYGFFAKIENGKKKYVLVTWQPYMK